MSLSLKDHKKRHGSPIASHVELKLVLLGGRRVQDKEFLCVNSPDFLGTQFVDQASLEDTIVLT